MNDRRLDAMRYAFGGVVGPPFTQRTVHARATGGQTRSGWRPYVRWAAKGRNPAIEVGIRRTITREYLELPEQAAPWEKPQRFTLTRPDTHFIRLEVQ